MFFKYKNLVLVLLEKKNEYNLIYKENFKGLISILLLCLVLKNSDKENKLSKTKNFITLIKPLKL